MEGERVRGRERQVSRMEAPSDTWCCNKAKWIVEEEERRGVALQPLLRCSYVPRKDGDNGSRQGRDRADVIFD